MLALLGLMSLALGPDPAFAGKVFDAFGGSGDRSGRPECDKGKYLVGVSIRTGLWWDQMRIVCAPARAGGALGPGEKAGLEYGGRGGGSPREYVCPEKTVMNGVYVILTKERQVAWVYLYCSPDPLKDLRAEQVDTAGSRFAEGKRSKQMCPVGEAAKGFRVNYGKHVNALGLVCDAFTPPAVVDPAVAEKARRDQREEEMRVTGKTVAQCHSSNQACEVRVRAQYGIVQAPVIIVSECTPFFQQCMANAAADLAAAQKPSPTADPEPAKDTGGPLTTSSCRIPGGFATVVIDNSKVSTLNVRDKPNGEILGQIEKGTQVEVVGGCGPRPAAGIVAQKQGGDQGGEKGWCAIASPIVGCVSDRFLAAGKPAVGIVAPRPDPEPDPTPGDGGPLTTSSCDIPGGTATVSIDDPNVDTLNVRDKPNGEVLTQIREGSQVEVVGGCGSRLGAGIVAQKPDQGQKAPKGWCAISKPVVGCVHQRFLVAGVPTGKDKPAAGLAAPSRSFTGSWDATAQDAGYDMSLQQDGNSLTGSYSSDDGSTGRIKGTVKGNVVRFSWTQTDGLSGRGKFTLAADGRSFTGSFTLSDNPDKVDGRWDGRRR